MRRPVRGERSRGGDRQGVDGDGRSVECQGGRGGGEQRRPHDARPAQDQLPPEAVGQRCTPRRQHGGREHANEDDQSDGRGPAVAEGDHAQRHGERELGRPRRCERTQGPAQVAVGGDGGDCRRGCAQSKVQPPIHLSGGTEPVLLRQGCWHPAAGAVQRKSRLACIVLPGRASGARWSATTLITPSAALEAAADHHRRCLAGDAAEPRPAALRHDDVDQPGLVLEVEERRALRGHRALAVGDHAGHDDRARPAWRPTAPAT